MPPVLQPLNRAQDPAGPTLAEITPINWHKYPPRVGSMTPAYVPVFTTAGGVQGDDVDTATATVIVDDRGVGDYAPRTQAAKATLLGTTLAPDITTPRGYIEPREPYGAAPVSPTDDPTITSLAPNTAVSNTAPTWVIITGTRFTPWSQVETGNVITPYSKYRSATKMDVLMDPRSSAGTVVVKVIDHGVKSTGSNFTFT